MSARDLQVRTTNRLEDDRQAVIDQLVAGKAADFAEYKRMVGEIKGINRSIARLKEEMRKYHGDEEFDSDE